MKRLGDILVESGFLNATELAEVLSVQKETGKRLGEVIVESGLMSEFDILRAVSSQYNYPIIDLSGIDVDPKATALLTQKFCEDNVVFPIGFDGDNLVVAIDDPMNITIEDELQFQTGYQISLMLATHTSIVDAIKVHYGRESANKAAEELGTSLASDTLDDDSELSEAVNSAPVVKLVNSMIDYAIRSGSSDIHIEPLEDRVRARIRIDGVMQEEVLTRITGYSSNKFSRQTKADRTYYEAYLKRVKKAGRSIALLEYTKSSSMRKEIINYCKKRGYSYYISNNVALK